MKIKSTILGALPGENPQQTQQVFVFEEDEDYRKLDAPEREADATDVAMHGLGLCRYTFNDLYLLDEVEKEEEKGAQ